MGCCNLSKLATIVCRITSIGFLIGIYTHKNAICSWEAELGNDFSIFTYFLGAYFSLHVFTWFIVFEFFFRSVIAIGLDFLLSLCNWSCTKRNAILLVLELIYGFWSAGEILGGWCDLRQIRDCVQNEESGKRICQGFVIRGVASLVQSVCMRMTSSYDKEEDAYFTTNTCIDLFRLCGQFLMTLISSVFTFVLL